MRLRKQQKKQQQSPPTPDAQRPAEPPPGDPTLPGSAGYRGIARLQKNAMPISRFTFKRPDGKP